MTIVKQGSTAAAMVVLTLAYWAAAVLGLQWAAVPGAGSPIWPAAGVAVAGLLLGGLRLWPAIVVGRLLAALAVGSPQPLWADFGIALANGLATAGGVMLLNRLGGAEPVLRSLAGLLRFVAAAGLVQALLAATLGVAVLVLAGLGPGEAFPVWRGWAIGNFAGVLTAGFAILAWRRPGRFAGLEGWHLLAVLAVTAALAAAVFLAPSAVARAYYVFPALVWAALAFQARGAAAALVIVSALAVWGTTHGLGPFADPILLPTASVRLLQEFVAISSLTALVLAVVADERLGRQALRESEARVRRVLDQLFTFVGITSLDGVLLEVNRAPLEAAGLEPHEVLGRPFWEAYWWSYSPAVQQELQAALAAAAAGRSVRYDVEVRMAGGRREVIDFQVGPLHDEDGRIVQLVASAVLVTERKRTEEALREAERRLNAVLDNASVAIFLMDDRQHCSYMNAAAERLTGYSFPEAAGRPLHDVIHHTRPDGSHFPIEECPIDRAFPENNNQKGEEIFVHKDGRFYPVAFTASPIRDEASKTVGTIIEVRDISAEKRNEAARDLLMREVDHRARNNLAVVQSIVQLTKAADVAGYRDAVLGRVSALARAQGSLADRKWEGAALATVVEEELTALARPGKYVLSGPEVTLAPEKVQPLSMIIHELGTNASKYGALSADQGQVEVLWRLTAEHGLVLVWRESGGPSVRPPARIGFGSRLVERLGRELEAEVAYDWRLEGLQVTLALPAEGVSRGGPPAQELSDAPAAAQ